MSELEKFLTKNFEATYGRAWEASRYVTVERTFQNNTKIMTVEFMCVELAYNFVESDMDPI